MAWTRTLFGVAGTSTVRGALIGSSLDLTGTVTIDKAGSDAGKLELQDFGTGGGAGTIAPNVFTRTFRADSGLYLSRNASFDLAAQTWARDDTAEKAQLVEIGQSGVQIWAVNAAANPITWVRQIFADHTGIIIGAGAAVVRFREKIEPEDDNTLDVGLSTKRWRDIYAGTSVRIGAAANAMRLGVHQIEGEEIADPAAPAVNRGIVYFRDNGASKTQLVVRFNTGAIQVIATEP